MVRRQQKGSKFHYETMNAAQKLAKAVFRQSDILFLTGPAGVGKTFLAVAFAIDDILQNKKERIVLSRPIVESGESLGFLPGSLESKVDPYMKPIYYCIGKLVGYNNPTRDRIDKAIDISPIAYLRGCTFDHSVCILDEAQNASTMQLKLFLTRLGENSKMIVNGDPQQSDLHGPVALVDVVNKLKEVPGIGFVEFNNSSIVRHPLVGRILEKL